MTGYVLVTGADGQVGSALKKATSGHDHFIFLSKSELDITDPVAISYALSELSPSIVVNTAAFTNVDLAEDSVELARLVNLTGPSLIAETCAKQGASLIHLSSDYVFGGGFARPALEDDPCNPIGVYAQSKLDAELRIRQHLDAHIILRSSWIFSGTHSSFPRSILRVAAQSGCVQVVDDQIGNPTSAQGLAEAILALVGRINEGAEIWGTYHFAQQPVCSRFEWARAILLIASELDDRFSNVEVTPVSSSAFAARAFRPGDSSLCSERLLALIPELQQYQEWQADLHGAIQEILNSI